MSKFIITTLLFTFNFLLSTTSFAQQNWQEADSLRQVYQDKQSYDTALVYANKALVLVEKQYGKNNVLYANVLDGLVNVYGYWGEYDKAIQYCKQEINIRKELKLTQTEAYIISIIWLGWLYQEKEDYKKALPLFLEGLENCEKTLGKDHSEYGNQLSNLASLYWEMGQYKKALPLHIEALKNCEKTLGKDHSEYGNRLSSLALLYQDMGNYDKALNLSLKALKNTEKTLGKEHPDYTVSLNNLAILYYYMGQYKKALPLYREVIENTEKKFGKEYSEYGNYLNNLIILYHNMGNYEDALSLALEALKSTDKTTLNYTYLLGNLTNLYNTMGDYEKSLSYSIKTLESMEKTLGKEHPEYGRELSNLASLYYNLGNYNRALPICIEALENTERSLGKNHKEYGACLSALASLYYTIDNYEKALPLYLEALEIENKYIEKYHTSDGKTLHNLAALYFKKGNYEKALPLYLEALENTEKLLGKEHPEYGGGLNSLAALYQAMKQYEKALPIYMEVIENTENSLGKEHSDYGFYLSNLASLYWEMGQYQKALPLYLEEITNINKNISKNFNFLSEKEKEAYFNMNNRNFELFNSFAIQSKEQYPGITTTVFDNTVRNKGILLKSSTAMRTAILNSKDTALINNYNNWISLNKKIVSLYSVPIIERQKDLKKLEEQANVLERDLVRSSQEFSAFTNTLKINWQDVQKALKPNEIAIEFLHFNLSVNNKLTDTTMYCALIISPKSKQPQMIPLFEEKQLEKIIGKFGGNNYSYINTIYGKNSEVNTDLYDLIWAPIDSFLDSICEPLRHIYTKQTKLKVYLSPSGLLHKISFSAIAKKQNVYLCDAYNIEVKSTTGKITETKASPKSSPKERTFLNTATLFGGITYNTDSTKQEIWSYLEGTKIETQKINKILKKGKVNVTYYSNTLATEEEFKLMASNSNILHIATHGFFYPDPKEVEKETEKINKTEIVFRGGNRGFGVESFVENRNPLMRSGLVFAGANDVWSKQVESDTIDDGVLTAQEVAQIDMRKSKLVVMSACETGLGDIKGSEGVYGLQRAFKMAGVNYMIMSLWQVPDNETEEFMTTFYKKLIRQKDIKQAFAKTQKEMRAKYDPYFWAAFVLIE